MRSKLGYTILAVTILSGLACNLTRSVMPNLGSQGGTVTDLWADVPKIDGLTKENLDLPLPARLAIQGYFKAASKDQGSLDFIAYTTAHTPQELANFYTLDKMQAAGWNMKDTEGCMVGDSSSGTSGGGMCFFGKEDKTTNTGTLLAIFIAQDNSGKKQNQVYFIRIGVANIATKQPN